MSTRNDLTTKRGDKNRKTLKSRSNQQFKTFYKKDTVKYINIF